MPRLTWAGARNVDTLVLLGTPNAGSLIALKQLTRGFELVPFLLLEE